jgi:hypothetical protein
MARLEDLTRGAAVKGILPEGSVTVVDVKWHGSTVVELIYKDASGRLGSELLYRDREPTLDIAATGRAWSFDGDGALFRLVSEAYRIRLASLKDSPPDFSTLYPELPLITVQVAPIWFAGQRRGRKHRYPCPYPTRHDRRRPSDSAQHQACRPSRRSYYAASSVPSCSPPRSRGLPGWTHRR